MCVCVCVCVCVRVQIRNFFLEYTFIFIYSLYMVCMEK